EVRVRSRRWVLRVAAVALVTALIGTGWSAQRRAEAGVAAALAQAGAALDTASRDLGAARADAREVLAASAGRVADNAVRRDLAALLVDLPRTDVTPGTPRPRATTLAHERADAAAARTARIVDATQAVRDARAAWEHERALAAHAGSAARLSAAVEESAALLASSEGHVLDDGPRVALAEVVAEASAVRDAPAPTGTDALAEAAAVAEGLVDRLAVARAEVGAAQEAWQAEQDRAAAERAAARATQSAGGGASRAPRATSGPASSGRASSGSSSGTAGTGSGRYDGWGSGWFPGDPVPDGWTVVVETEGGGWGGDNHGNVWDLG
ncbi:hypothetical protein G6556_06025, partial [Cellulomonas sp. IC4_254]|nr:hypothetical protein [Cellulomonas sp. IC4_254]